LTEETGKRALDGEILEHILEATRKLAQPLDLDTMLAHVIDEGRKVLRADRGTVFLYDARTDELFSKVATGTDTLRMPADKGIVGEAARTRQVVNVPDCYADPRFNREIDRQTGYRTRCPLSVPLIGYDDALVGVLQVLNKQDGIFTEDDEHIALALGAQCAVALQRARMLEEILAKEKMERELAVARDIQMRVFPKKIPELDGYDIAGWSRPADETGGDIFDVIRIADKSLLLLLGDATGHGIGAALSVTQVRSMLRMCMRLGAGLDKSFQHINDQLSDDLASNRFVTAFLGVLDAAAHTIDYHSGGQGPILCLRSERGECEWLNPSTVPMGMMPGPPMKRPEPLMLGRGDILALITDGIYEYENPAAEQFEGKRVEELILEHQNEPMTSLVERIVRRVDEFAEGASQNDDMTLLLVRRLPES
jgi:phosphoserine phosphatase